MASCEKQLIELVRAIEPTATQKDGAKRSHNYLRDILTTGQMEKRIVESYLSGSYPRDTAIRPLDDVDIVFVIDPSQWPKGLFDYFFGEPPEPEVVLKAFLNAIRYRYEGSSLRMQNRSVRLNLHHLNIDVVPAIDRVKGDGSILIPDRAKEGWIVTAPKKHSEIATSINKQVEGRFKPLVKLLKLWNYNLPSTARFKSFAIETLAARLFQNIKVESLEEGLLLFFDFVGYLGDNAKAYRWSDKYGISLGWFVCSIPDLADTGSNVAAGTSEDRKESFIEKAVVSRNKLLEARDARSDDTAWNRTKEALRC